VSKDSLGNFGGGYLEHPGQRLSNNEGCGRRAI